MSQEHGNNQYFIDPERAAEMARLLTQEVLLNAGMGGPLPERNNDFTGIHHVLDIGCGPGGWIMEIAASHPEIELVGIDISEMMTSYAHAQGHAQGIHKVRFRIMDATQPLAFDDASFDLVNGRHIISFLRGDQWPALLQECWRITRPGGMIRLVGTELSGMTNSAAYHEIHNLFIRAMKSAGRSLIPQSPGLGVMAPLAQLISETGYRDVRIRPYFIDFSANTQIHHAMHEDLRIGFKLVMPFLERHTGTPLAELERMYEELLTGMASPMFHGYLDLYSIMASKP